MASVIAPVPDQDDQFFWDGVADSKLLIRACAECDRLQHPPSPMCPACGSTMWGQREASGRGTVHSWIVSQHPTQTGERDGSDGAARIVALIDLAEGVRLVSNLVDVETADVRNDMAVEVMFADVDGVRLPQFRPATESRDR